MPKKLTIIGVLAALVLGIVGLAQQNAEAYNAQSYCIPGGCVGGASPVDVIMCYGGSAPTVLGTCGAGSSPNVIATAGSGAITNYTQIVIPTGSRLTLPVTFTPAAWGVTTPATCINDEASGGGVTCTGANQTGDVTSTTDLLCDGTIDVLAKPGIGGGAGGAVGTWPGGVWAGQGFEYYRTYDTGTGVPTDENAYVVANAPWPAGFTFKSIDKSRLRDLWLGGTFDLNLVTLTGAATPLQLIAADSSYASLSVSAALLAGSPAPPSGAYLCLQSPQNSVSSNNTLVVPLTDGYYPRWVDIQSDIDFVDGSVNRVVVMNCVEVGTVGADADNDCWDDSADTNPALADQDSDGLPDGLENANGSSPTNADADGDTANDFTELFTFTDPNNNDTDGDGRLDKANNLAGFNATSPYWNQAATTDNCPSKANNVVGDLQLNTDAKPDNTLTPAIGATDVTNPHADYLGDACDTDDDNDGIGDVAEAGPGGLGVWLSAAAPGVGQGWCHSSDPGGGVQVVLNSIDPDHDNDGGLDGLECQFTGNPNLATGTQARFPNAGAGEDPDLDLLFRPAGANADAENLYHTNNISIGAATCPVVLAGACSGGLLLNIDGDYIGGDAAVGTADGDSDGDGLIDGVEVKNYGTAPSNFDTDGDGCSDGKEAGDINGDRKVTAIDLGQVAARFGNITVSGVMDQTKINYDFNRSGKIDAIDLGGVAKVFGNCPAQTGKTPTNLAVIVH